MNLSKLFKIGLVLNNNLVDENFKLSQLDNDYFINQSENDKVIITYNNIEFLFLFDKLIYWQIDNYNLKISFGNSTNDSKMNFINFLKFLEKENINWEFNKDLCFSEQISIMLSKTKVNFIFSFDDKIEGKIEIIGKYF